MGSRKPSTPSNLPQPAEWHSLDMLADRRDPIVIMQGQDISR
jgi:hypothetical protein